MSTITLPLPDEDLNFLRAYASAQGISVEVLLAQQARNLRENLQRPLHPDIARASGIVSPDIEGEAAHLAHLDKKHS